MWAVKSSLCCFVSLSQLLTAQKRRFSDWNLRKARGGVSGRAAGWPYRPGVHGFWRAAGALLWRGPVSCPWLPRPPLRPGAGLVSLTGLHPQGSKVFPVGSSSHTGAGLTEKVTTLSSSLPRSNVISCHSERSKLAP